jgi:hypothetical protein
MRLIARTLQQVAKERGIPEEMEAVGDELPDVIPMGGSWEKMVEDTRDNVIDVLFCAMFITKARSGFLDFTYPYLETGYRMVVRTRNDVGAEFDVVTGIFANPSPISYFFVLFLVVLAVVYAHIMYGIALISNTDGISTNYGHGVFDTWWLAMVTATTGDAAPRNSFITRRRCEYSSSASPPAATIWPYQLYNASFHFVCLHGRAEGKATRRKSLPESLSGWSRRAGLDESRKCFLTHASHSWLRRQASHRVDGAYAHTLVDRRRAVLRRHVCRVSHSVCTQLEDKAGEHGRSDHRHDGPDEAGVQDWHLL